MTKMRTYLSLTRPNAPEMIKNRENKEVVEIEQTERPQQSAMRLE
jgi:hypothetical protein